MTDIFNILSSKDIGHLIFFGFILGVTFCAIVEMIYKTTKEKNENRTM